jgi:hypothetical protein
MSFKNNRSLLIMSKVPKVEVKREVAFQAQIGPQKEDEHGPSRRSKYLSNMFL